LGKDVEQDLHNIAFAQQLETERLILRSVSKQDAAFFDALLGHPVARKYLGGPVPKEQRKVRFEAYLTGAQGIGIWLICLKANDSALGLVVLNPHQDGAEYEISYEFLPQYWGNGYAREAALKVIAHARDDIGLQSVLAETQTANLASVGLLQSLNMIEVLRLERFGAQQVIMSTKPVKT